MNSIDEIARAAGFRKANEISTNNDQTKVAEFGGMDIIGEPLMPKGWFAMRGKNGAICVGPKRTFYVPAFDPDELMKKTFYI